MSIRPSVRFFDSDGRRVRPAPFRWISEDSNVAAADEDLGIITSFSYGITDIYAETTEGGLRSNRIPLEVVHVKRIRIVPEDIEIAMGGRLSFEAVCTLADGSEDRDLYLIWTEDDPSVARVSSSGMVYGCGIGVTQVAAADDGVMSDNNGTVRVTEGIGGGAGKGRGRGYPRVLVSGEIDPDPDTGEYVRFSREEPPVWQRVEDVERSIWWINSASPLAALYLDKGGGYGYGSREWRMYHVERYIDVIVQIALTYGAAPQGESKTASDWILDWGSKVAEIQVAVAADLSRFIADGALPAG